MSQDSESNPQQSPCFLATRIFPLIAADLTAEANEAYNLKTEDTAF